MESKIQYYDWAYNIDIIFFFIATITCENIGTYWFQYLDVNTESVGRVTLQ